jgi:SHAQKYF class myb-like DNA-binding protein
MEAAASAPDLSLHISLPSSNDASPSSAPGLGAGIGGRGAAAGGDPWRRLNGSTASTELSISPPPPPPRTEGAAGALAPWQVRPTMAANSPSSSSAEAAAFLPVTVPRMTLDATARARPINGVPVYRRDSTFLGGAGDYRQRHAKVGLYSPYPSSAWPSSSLRSTTAPAPVDATYLSPSSYHRMMSGTSRLHGALADTLRGYGGAGRRQHHFGSGLASSRYMPRLPASGCGMRAPRMRWTSTLHTRFVHAVELLGGHERESPPQLRSTSLSSLTPRTQLKQPFLGNFG